MRDPALVQVTGPLAPFAEVLPRAAEQVGLCPAVAGRPPAADGGSESLAGRASVERLGLSPEVVAGFMLDRRAAGHRHGRSARSLRPLLECLREIGVAPAVAAPLVLGPVEVMLADYAAYLARERGLAAVTVQRETDLLRPFLAARVVGDVLDLRSLTAGAVTAFMLARSESASPATVQRTGTALRSLLRFLHLRGMIDTSLAGAVPTAANWKQAGLPKYLTPEQTRMLLASCDPATAVGRRDVAKMPVGFQNVAHARDQRS